MENAGAPNDHDMLSESPERQEPYGGPSAFPWMGHYQATPVEAFPALHGPIVHEGFVPDDDNGMDLENQADYTANWPAPASPTLMYRPRFRRSLVDNLADRDPPRSPSEVARFAMVEDRDGGSLDEYSDDNDDSSVSDDDSR
jgi:hypothetical protein